LTLDFAWIHGKDWLMMSRRGISVFVGVLAVSALTGGCSRKEMGVANTAAIREETTTIAAPVESDAPTTTSSPATAPTAAASVPEGDPKPVGDDYRGRVIVRAVPKTDLEREVVEAVSELLAKRSRFQMLNTTDREVLAEVLVGTALNDFIERGLSVADEILQKPGASDRMVIDSIEVLSPDIGKAVVCEVDGTVVYVQDSAGRFVLDDPGEISTVRWELQIVRVPEGWRISVENGLQIIDGLDKCAG
jgi:hypothetical protein